MGHGIAQAAAAAGFEVTLRDVSEELVARGLRAVESNLSKGVERGKVSEEERERALSLIRITTRLEETASSDLFVEAVPERLDLKRETLRAVEELSGDDFIFATNTSSLSITEIAEGSLRPGRVVGMHFFNPVHIMRLVEIVKGRETAPETVEAVRAVVAVGRGAGAGGDADGRRGGGGGERYRYGDGTRLQSPHGAAPLDRSRRS
jgi:3-hydroxybutyryl-CoA dehydrogenase